MIFLKRSGSDSVGRESAMELAYLQVPCSVGQRVGKDMRKPEKRGRSERSGHTDKKVRDRKVHASSIDRRPCYIISFTTRPYLMPKGQRRGESMR